MATDEERPKVISLRLRRRKQLGDAKISDDPVAMLADELTKLMGDQQKREVKEPSPQAAFIFACHQLLAIEFATNALLKVMEKALGPEMLNAVLVEVERRRHQYKVEWPDGAEDKTYLEHLPEGDDADVIPFSPDEPPDAG